MNFPITININYLIVFEQISDITEVANNGNSIFQGFANGLINMNWVFRLILDLPSDIYDFGSSREVRLRKRMTGLAWRWMALYAEELRGFAPPDNEMFWIAVTGDDNGATHVLEWRKRRELPVLHISTSHVDPNAIDAEVATWKDIRDFIQACGQAIKQLDCDYPLSSLQETLSHWCEPEPFQSNLEARPHNCTLPNLLTLKCFGANFRSERKLLPGPDSENEYVEAIRASAAAVYEMRDEAGPEMIMASRPFKSDLIIVAPSTFMAWRAASRSGKRRFPEIEKVIDLLRQQTGYFFTGEGKRMSVLASEPGRYIMAERMKELNLQTNVIALKAASIVAPVLRLPNGINQAVEISKFADHLRSRKSRGAPRKTKRIFERVQTFLQRYTHEEFMPIIERSTGVKLVSDAPLEWLPVGDLTLGLAKAVSRVPTTPGNMMVLELANKIDYYFKPEAFQEISVISSFGETDCLKDLVCGAMELMAQESGGRLKVNIKRVKTEEEFVDGINACETPILIFDLHGSHSKTSGIGTLRVGDRDINIWALRGKIRPPPIVVLSACDTHSPDQTHVTVGAGFLNCGARTVLATLLPVNGAKAAVFAGRLALRAAWYSNAVVEDLKRATDWRQLVAGAQRLDFLAELLLALTGKYMGDQSTLEIAEQINMTVHAQLSDWWERSLLVLEQKLNLHRPHIVKFAADVIATTDTVKYIQLGDPETIVITSEAIHASMARAASS